MSVAGFPYGRVTRWMGPAKLDLSSPAVPLGERVESVLRRLVRALVLLVYRPHVVADWQ